MPKAAQKKPRRYPSGRRTVLVQFYPDDDQAAELIQAHLRRSFPGKRVSMSDAVRISLGQYADLLRAGQAVGLVK